MKFSDCGILGFTELKCQVCGCNSHWVNEERIWCVQCSRSRYFINPDENKPKKNPFENEQVEGKIDQPKSELEILRQWDDNARSTRR